MAIRISPIAAFSDNYIWLLQAQGTPSACVIDPGDATPVLSRLRQYGLRLGAIFITHHHWDHTDGIDGLLEHCSVPVYGPQSSKLSQIDHPLAQGDKVAFAGIQFQIIEVPGHTLDHIAYYGKPSNQAPILFCGDTLFSAGCGRLFEGTPQIMYQSLAKLAGLPDNTRVYCAHEYTQANLNFAHRVEPENAHIINHLTKVSQLRQKGIPTLPSSLGNEKRINPFLRCTEPVILQAATNHQGREPSDAADTFAILRAWKDNFVL